MALRNQPYFPLYVNDFLSDEKLNDCSASSVGVYIKLMCLMHKSEIYGVILLKQKYKQNTKQIKNFASQFAMSMCFDFATVENALDELVAEKVLIVDGDKLIQKRMVKDADISEKRATAGKTGGDKTKNKTVKDKKFAQAKVQANTEDEYISENVIDFKNKKNELCVSLVNFFEFNGIHYNKQRMEISAFVKTQVVDESFYNHFLEQFQNYQDYKELTKEQKHHFNTYLGTQNEAFEDGKWNKENWGSKILKFKNGNKSKTEKIDDMFEQVIKETLANGNNPV